MMRFISLTLVASCFIFAGCAKKKPAPPSDASRLQSYLTQATQPVRRATASPAGVAKGKALFDRLGATPKVSKIVDDFVLIVAMDARVNFTRKGHARPWQPTPEEVSLLKARLIEFISNTTGGNADYSGADMQTAHAGMEITNGEFDAALADFQQALEKNQVPEPEQRELLVVIAATRSRVVQSGVAGTTTAPATRPR